ncbi:hypothetical protein QTN25_007018 [Entamoeba marina]
MDVSDIVINQITDYLIFVASHINEILSNISTIPFDSYSNMDLINDEIQMEFLNEKTCCILMKIIETITIYLISDSDIFSLPNTLFQTIFTLIHQFYQLFFVTVQSNQFIEEVLHFNYQVIQVLNKLEMHAQIEKYLNSLLKSIQLIPFQQQIITTFNNRDLIYLQHIANIIISFSSTFTEMEFYLTLLAMPSIQLLF